MKTMHPQSAPHCKTQSFLRAVSLLGCLLIAPAGGALAAPTVHTIEIDGMQFSPSTLEVHAGDTVIWKNKDPFPHTATSDRDGFHSGDIAAGRSWKFVAKKRGSFPYSCALHETMKGMLIVK